MKLQDAITAVKANPRDPDAWVALGDAMAGTGETDKARESYQRALKIAPEHAQALSGIARLDLPPWLLAVPSELPRTPTAPLPEPPAWKPIESVARGAGLEPGQRRWDHGRAGRGREWDTPVAEDDTVYLFSRQGCLLVLFVFAVCGCGIMFGPLRDAATTTTRGISAPSSSNLEQDAWLFCGAAVAVALDLPIGLFPTSPVGTDRVTRSGSDWRVRGRTSGNNPIFFTCTLKNHGGDTWELVRLEAE